MAETLDDMQQRIEETFCHVDETALIVLKGHLLIEEALEAIISTFVHHAAFIENARLGFPQKIAIARAMSLDEHENRMWEIATALNSLRNDLAHALDSPKRARKVRAVIELYHREIEIDAHLAVSKDQPEHVVLFLAIGFFLGFLSTFQSEVIRFREHVDALDFIVNPHRNKAAGAPDGT
jgi:hypothetical protein